MESHAFPGGDITVLVAGHNASSVATELSKAKGVVSLADNLRLLIHSSGVKKVLVSNKEYHKNPVAELVAPVVGAHLFALFGIFLSNVCEGPCSAQKTELYSYSCTCFGFWKEFASACWWHA